jgi:hypothetical protein
MKKMQQPFTRFLVCLSLLSSSYGCSKTENVGVGNNVVIKNSNSIIVSIYKETLGTDTTFIQLIENYELIKNQQLVGLNVENYDQMDKIEKSLRYANTKEKIVLAYKLNGVTEYNTLLNLFEQQFFLMQRLLNKYPNIQQLNKVELADLFLTSKLVVVKNKNPNNYKIMKDCTNDCCRAYVNGMSDCSNSFMLSSAAVVLIGIGEFVMTKNLFAAEFTVVAGLGVTNLENISCQNSIVRDYKLCMHYE